MTTLRAEVPPGRIDLHAHVALPTPDFAEESGDDRWPELRTDGKGGATLFRGGRAVRTLPESAHSSAARLADMDRSGTAVQVLSPVPPLICDWTDEPTGSDWARELNQSMAAVVAEHPTRLLGIGTAPLQRPRDAVRIVGEAQRLGLVGIEIGCRVGGRELDDPSLLEFFQAACHHGMLVFVHPLVLGANADWTDRIVTTETSFGIGMPTDTAIAAYRLIAGGVLDACPGLKVLLAHGGGTFPWLLPRIARLLDESQRERLERAAHEMHVDTVLFDPLNVRHVTQVLGINRVVFGTDYPMAGSDSLEAHALDALDGADRRLVERENALRLLGMEPNGASRS